MALITYGGGGSGIVAAQLMEEDADTVYLGRVSGGAWADVSTTAMPTLFNSSTNIKYTYDSNIPGVPGVIVGDGSDIFYQESACAHLQITTVTVEMVASIWRDGASNGVVMANTGESESANAIYTLRIRTADGESFECFTENGAGNNRAVSGSWKTNSLERVGGGHHWAVGCEADGTQTLYCDGLLVVSEAGTAATGGTDAYLSIGSYQTNAGTNWLGVIRDVRISNVAKSEAQIVAAAARALGTV